VLLVVVVVRQSMTQIHIRRAMEDQAAAHLVNMQIADWALWDRAIMERIPEGNGTQVVVAVQVLLVQLILLLVVPVSKMIFWEQIIIGQVGVLELDILDLAAMVDSAVGAAGRPPTELRWVAETLMVSIRVQTQQ
jgi:hypothetical protein